MTAEKKLGRSKRFGARYGRSLKLKHATVEEGQRKRYKCPYCSAVKVKRISAGIWGCRKCGSKFAGRAYSLYTATTVTTLEEKPLESKQEDKPKEVVV